MTNLALHASVNCLNFGSLYVVTELQVIIILTLFSLLVGRWLCGRTANLLGQWSKTFRFFNWSTCLGESSSHRSTKNIFLQYNHNTLYYKKISGTLPVPFWTHNLLIHCIKVILYSRTHWKVNKTLIFYWNLRLTKQKAYDLANLWLCGSWKVWITFLPSYLIRSAEAKVRLVPLLLHWPTRPRLNSGH